MELSEDQLRLLVDCSPEPIAIFMMENDCVLRTYSYTKDLPSFFGLKDFEYAEKYTADATKAILSDDLPIFQNAVRRVLAVKSSSNCTCRYHHGIKETIWVHAILKCIGEFNGKKAILEVFTDVSNQLAEDTPGGFFIYAAEENDQFLFVGENMLRMLGYSRTEFQNKFHNQFRYLVYEADRESTLKSIDKQIYENGNYDNVDYRIEKKDGTLIWVHDEGHYVVDKDNRACFYVTINDMNYLLAAADSLKRENEKLDKIIRSIPVGVSVYRISKNEASFVAINNALCRILDIPEDQIGKATASKFLQRVHADDVNSIREFMRQSLQVGKSESRPFRHMGKNGKWQWLRIDTETNASEEDTVIVYAAVTDLTAEIEAEDSLEKTRRAQQDKYQATVETLILANPQSLCTVLLNLTRDKCIEWFGTSQFVINTIQAATAEGVIENISHIIINEDDRNRFLEHFDRTALIKSFRNGQTRDIVRYRRTIEDGTSIWVETVVNLVENPETHDIEAVLFSENVNNQVLNERIIQKSTDIGYEYIATLQLPQQIFRFRFMASYIPEKYRGLYEDMQRSIPFSEIVNYATHTWVAPDEAEHFRDEANVAGIIKRLDESESYTITIKSQHEDGSEGWKQIRLTWLLDTKDWVLIQQSDISDVVHTQKAELLERLDVERALRNEADNANESKSNFISNVSHDMRTPLNAILGYDRLALETDSSASRVDYLKKIGDAGETLLSLINDTLDLQKIENGVTTLHLSPAPCSAVVNGIITAVKPIMDAKKINFIFDNSKAVWAAINVDAMRVEEIFINLLSNAAKFTPEGGTVLLAVECEKETETEIYDKLTVKDNGVGISAEFLPKIYEPFAQERNEKTAGIGGSGLGLSIVKRLVTLMHGKIEVKSELGVGTEFTVYLTFQKAEPDISLKSDDKVQKAIVLTGKKVLLCEDNEMNREIATAILKKSGINVIPEKNGKRGVERFVHSKRGDIAAILMDIRMPVMDGYEATRAIRGSGHPDAKSIPIIALSADAYSDDIQKARDCGMNRHLSKPLDPVLLLQTLSDEIRKADRN